MQPISSTHGNHQILVFPADILSGAVIPCQSRTLLSETLMNAIHLSHDIPYANLNSCNPQYVEGVYSWLAALISCKGKMRRVTLLMGIGHDLNVPCDRTL